MPASRSDAHPGLADARPLRAAGPAEDAEALRRAYLDLLKLCLCDLQGMGTTSVGRSQEGLVWARELSGDQLRLRSAGMDWPLHGLTMVGLRRLDDLQECVEALVRDGVEGDLIEAGAWRGGASILMRATLDALGASERTVVVADSFEGFPEEERAVRPGELDDLSGFDFLSVPAAEVRAGFERLGLGEGVRLVPGFFADTMPLLAGRRWSLIRLDADTYEATRLALESLYPGLASGGYLVVDDYGALEECRRAIDEFRDERGIAEPLEEVDWTGVRWRRESSPEPGPAVAPEPLPDPPARAPEADRPPPAIPTIRELKLDEELRELRRRLADAEAELVRLRNSRAVRAADWLRRRLVIPLSR